MDPLDDGVTLGVFPGDWDGVDAKVAKEILEGRTDELRALVEYHSHGSRISGQPCLLEAVGDVCRASPIATDDLEEVGRCVNNGERVEGKPAVAILNLPRSDHVNRNFVPWFRDNVLGWKVSIAWSRVFLHLAGVAPCRHQAALFLQCRVIQMLMDRLKESCRSWMA